MSPPLWVIEAAAGFWNRVGEEEPFPRALRMPITRAYPITLIERSPLCLSEVLTWLSRMGIEHPVQRPDRPLRACLVARVGSALLFLDAEDSPEEHRFSLAHEMGHFLRDYQAPRQRAVEHFGPEILEVLDGLRPPQPEERLHAILRQVPLGLHVHLMQRGARGETTGSVARAEREADQLAWQLLAPADLVLAEARTVDAAGRLLREMHGFPHSQSRRYAQALFPSPLPRDAFFSHLKNSVKKPSSFASSKGSNMRGEDHGRT